MSERMLIAEEMSKLLRRSKASIYDATRRGLIPHIKIGRQILWPEQAIKEWIAGGGSPLPAEPDKES